MLLEKKVEAVSGALEAREAQLGEVLAATQLEPATLRQVCGHCRRILGGHRSQATTACQACPTHSMRAENQGRQTSHGNRT